MDPGSEYQAGEKGKGAPNPAVLYGLLIASVLFAVFLVLDYRMNWQSWDYPEGYYPRIVRNGPGLVPEDIARIFNADDTGFLQNTGRVRYFQNLVLLLDAKARVWLFRYLPPHPSVSLAWVTTLLAPVFFFKFLRLWSNDPTAAKIGTILFILSTGFLSHINLICNPGKALATFIGVVSLYLAEKTRVRLASSGRLTRPVLGSYLLLLLFLYIGFFTDEIAWIFLLLVPLLVPGLFQVRETRGLSAAIYASVLLLITVSVLYVAPELIRRATPGNPRISILALNLAPCEDSAPLSRFWEWFNLPYLVRSIRNLLSRQLVLIGKPWTLLAYFFIVPYFLLAYSRMEPFRRRLAVRSLAALFLFIGYQAFGFASVYHEDGFAILNPYYYGSQLAIFLPIPISLFLSRGKGRAARLINTAILLFLVGVLTHNYFPISREIRKSDGGFSDYGHLEWSVALEAYERRNDPEAIGEIRKRFPPRSPWSYIQEVELSARENARRRSLRGDH